MVKNVMSCTSGQGEAKHEDTKAQRHEEMKRASQGSPLRTLWFGGRFGPDLTGEGVVRQSARPGGSLMGNM